MTGALTIASENDPVVRYLPPEKGRSASFHDFFVFKPSIPESFDSAIEDLRNGTLVDINTAHSEPPPEE